VGCRTIRVDRSVGVLQLPDVGADTPEHLTARDTLVGAWAAFAATGSPGRPPYAPEGASNSRAIGGSPPEADRMITEPPADDVTGLERRWSAAGPPLQRQEAVEEWETRP
jgi:hypothetical protein